MFKFFPLVFLLGLLGNHVFSRDVLKFKNLQYSNIEKWGLKMQTLDLYLPKNHGQDVKIMIFIHGGSWQDGKKNLYRPMAKRLARRGIASVIINYPKIPNATIDQTFQSCAKAIKFLEGYQSNLDIRFSEWYLSGHSAGGHLAAMLALDDSWIKEEGVKARFKGLFLLDAFGLDLFQYLNTTQTPYTNKIHNTFGKSKLDWQKYSPINYIGRNPIKFAALIGENTYPEIKVGNERFFGRLAKEQISYTLDTVPKRNHVGMVVQFLWKNTKWYNSFVDFVQPTSPE